MDRVLALAAETGAELVIANDPDADRLAAAVPDPSGRGYRVLTGNELGALLADDAIEHAETGGRPKLVVTTIVSSSLLVAHGARPRRRLPRDAHRLQVDRRRGAARARARASPSCSATRRRSATPCGPLVRDKDGIGAALRLRRGRPLPEGARPHAARPLDELLVAHGLDAPGAVVGAAARQPRAGRGSAPRWPQLRRRRPAQIGASPRRPRARRGRGRGARGRRDAARSGLPRSDVLAFQAEDGSRLTVRPSGTEPKIKFYLELVGRAASPAEVAPARARLEAEAQAVRATLVRELQPRLTRRRRRRGTGAPGTG